MRKPAPRSENSRIAASRLRAIGVIAGGLVGSRYGWRAAFLLVGVPSLALTVLAWRLEDPPRGGQDRLPADTADGPRGGLFEGVLGLFRTPTFVMVCVVGMLVAFAVGAFNHPQGRWNSDPADVDRAHTRLWDWRDLQVLRAWHAGPNIQNYTLFTTDAVRLTEP